MNYTIAIVLTNLTDNSSVVTRFSINWSQTNVLVPHQAIAQNFTLQHLQYYNETFGFNASTSGTWKMQFLLFTEGQQISQNAYLEVHLWLNVKA